MAAASANSVRSTASARLPVRQPADRPSTPAASFRLQPMRPEDIPAIVLLSSDSLICRDVLKPRYHSLKIFLEAVGAASHSRASAVAHDGAGHLLGWAACVKFHERAGYAGVAHMALDVADHFDRSEIAAGLVGECARQAALAGVHTLISFVASNMQDMLAWHRSQSFHDCGFIRLAECDELHVFALRPTA